MHKSVLVTGGAGYIGSHAAWALIDAGINVVVLDNLSTGFEWLVPAAATFIKGDVGDREFVRSQLRNHEIAAVMHFAGSIIVAESIIDPLKYYRNNTSASRNLIEACIDEGVDKFIFSSTAAVYGNSDRVFVDEETPTLPLSPYGNSKLATEWMLRDISAATPLRHVTLRYFNVAGADPEGRSGQATPKAMSLFKAACEAATGRRQGIEIFGDNYATPDGTCVRDFIHVSDLAQAHLAALAYLEGNEESTTLNCGYGQGYSVREVLDVFANVSGQPLDISVGGRRTGDIEQIVADNAKILKTLDWTPRHEDIEAMVRTALGWEKDLLEKG
ncbi:MAG: UDP-glucose 4-epimerase GalE [Rhodospirillales bacterium]|nr:UDP-glucose 4-epimerase GalE [Rhodospirillales bacterium]